MFLSSFKGRFGDFLIKGFLSFFKAFFKGFLSFLKKAFLRGSCPFLRPFWGFFKGFLSFLNGLFKAFLKELFKDNYREI